MRRLRVPAGSDSNDESPKEGLSNAEEKMAEKSRRPVLLELVFNLCIAGAISDFFFLFPWSFLVSDHTGRLLQGLTFSECKYGIP